MKGLDTEGAAGGDTMRTESSGSIRLAATWSAAEPWTMIPLEECG